MFMLKLLKHRISRQVGVFQHRQFLQTVMLTAL